MFRLLRSSTRSARIAAGCSTRYPVRRMSSFFDSITAPAGSAPAAAKPVQSPGQVPPAPVAAPTVEPVASPIPAAAATKQSAPARAAAVAADAPIAAAAAAPSAPAAAATATGELQFREDSAPVNDMLRSLKRATDDATAAGAAQQPVADTPYSHLPAITQSRLDELDHMLRFRSAFALTTEYPNFESFWIAVCKRADERAAHIAKHERTGQTLGETVLAPALSTFESRTKQRKDQRAADDAVIAKAIADGEAAGDKSIRVELKNLERDFGISVARPHAPGLNHSPASELWKRGLIEKYPNMTWSEIQRLLKDTDADYWNPMDPAIPKWPWRGHPTLFKRAESSDIDAKQQELMGKFETMIEAPWEMHSSRSVKVTKGGKIQSFKTLLFAGNQNGFGGYAIGKHETMEGSKEMAWKELMNSMIFLPRLHGRTLFHDVEGRFSRIRARFHVRKEGTGNKAPNFGMIVLNGFGLNDVALTILGGQNPYSWMHAIFDGLYRELDYNDIPVPAPDEAEWEMQTDRVRDAVVDQVYINPIVYPERMMTAEEKSSNGPNGQGYARQAPLPSKGFAKPYHQTHVANQWKRQWVTPGPYSKMYKTWMGKRGDWQLASMVSASRDTEASAARNRK